MELKIYEIPHKMQLALDALRIDEETGEIVGYEQLDALTESATVKIANTARYIRYAETQIEAMKQAKKAIEDRVRTAQKLVDWLKVRSSQAILALPEDKRKIEEPDIRVSIRKSHFVNITDYEKIDEKFFNETIVRKKELSKVAIEAAIKSGEKVEGATLETNYRLQIK